MAEQRRGRAARVWTTGARLRNLVLMCWAMLLLVSVTAIGSIQLQSDNLRELTQVDGPARNANDEVRQAMTDAQTGLYAFQVSGDRVLLQPYVGASTRTMTALATLQDKLGLGVKDGADAKAHERLAAGQRLAVEQWWASALPLERALARGERTDFSASRVLFARFLAANARLGEHLTDALAQSRLAAHSLESRGRVVSIAAALLALVGMLVLGRRVARTISTPLTDLRDTVVRLREGELGVRAREDQGSSEIRSLAADFNSLTDQKVALQQIQAGALSMNELTFGIARAIRAASDTRQALQVLCAALGEGLGGERVLASTFDAEGKVLLDAEWHLPDLPRLADLSVDLHSHLGLLAEEIWLSEGFRSQDDVLVAEGQSPEPGQMFRRETGARAVIMAPIGLGNRVIGIILVLMVHQPREWTGAEGRAVHQVAGFAARAIVHSDDRAHQSEYVQRLEALDRQKSDFLATVSHELRTPLTSITGYLELLQEGEVGELTGGQLAMFEVINRNTGRLRNLIEDVMVLSRIEGGVTRVNFVEVSISALITRVSEELGPLAHKNAIELEIDGGPEAALVLGDKTSLDRAVVNILSNAIKFSRPGGVVTIRGTLDRSAGRVRITCQDTGVGIPAHDQAELFTRFFRASNAMEQAIPGTGLGLSIVKQIVEDHGGELQLISTEEEGTTVIIDLTLYEPARTAAIVGNDSQRADVFDIRA